MREILFRGKRLDNGELVFGDFRHIFHGEYRTHIEDNSNGLNNGVCGLEVDPSTVGQFTGLTDRNGVKIFEGDIVNYNGEPGYVGFDKENAEFLIFFSKWTAGFDSIYCDRNAEVIGDIYDNPELLEVNESD